MITTQGTRSSFKSCLLAISSQVDHVYVVHHTGREHKPLMDSETVTVISYPADPPNISQMWNIGIRLAMNSGASHVAVLNDDVIVPDGWVDRLASHGKWLASPPCDEIRTDQMAGYAFLLSLDEGRIFLADEQFQWWGGDTDLCLRAKKYGQFIADPAATVEHLTPNSSTVGDLALIAGQDRERFRAKWGWSW